MEESANYTPTLAEGRPAPIVDDPRPHRVGRFTVLEELGRGGMGVVYAAYDPDLDRRVALKLLRGVSYEDEDVSTGRARLLREAQAMARLAHPNVVTVYEVGTVDERVFLAMEFVDGQTLDAWVEHEGRRGGWRAILPLFLQAAQGLAAAHRAGLIHRDFKPHNVLVDVEGRARVLDFGLARAAGVDGPAASPEASIPAPASDLDTPLTVEGQVMGTPAYMAPEQFLGGDVDARSDQYSFCVALYEALHGVRPFVGHDFEELRERVLAGERPVPPEGSDVPAWLHRVMVRGLSRQPDDRYATLEALIEQLRRDPAHRNRRLLAWSVAALALVGAAWAYRSYVNSTREPLATADPCDDAPERLAGVWDDTRRQQVRDAFASTALGSAEETWERVRSQLDDYAGRWSEARRAICRATKVEGSQPQALLDVRQACLNRQLSELRAHTAVFARSDPMVVERAAAGIESLEDPDDCRTIEDIQARIPLPEDESAAARVVELRQRLDDVKALLTVVDDDRAVELATQVVAEAEQLGYLPLVAEARMRLAMGQARQAHLDEAELTFEQAMWAAEVGRHDAAAVDIWNEWTRTVGYNQGRMEDAQPMVRRLDAALHRLGDDPLRRAAVDKTLGTLAFADRRFEAAVEHFERAREILVRELGPDHGLIASSNQNLGTALYRAGRLDEAEQILTRGLEIWTQLRGENHPALSSMHQSLGGLARLQKDPEAAKHHYRRALELFGSNHPPDHPGLIPCRRNLALAHQDAGELDEAIRWFRAALDVEHVRTGGPEPPYVTSAQLGEVLVEAGRAAEAVPHLEVMLAHPEASEDDPGQLAEARFALARALWDSDPSSRHRARTLAQEAREAFAAHGKDEEIARADDWLRSH